MLNWVRNIRVVCDVIVIGKEFFYVIGKGVEVVVLMMIVMVMKSLYMWFSVVLGFDCGLD